MQPNNVRSVLAVGENLDYDLFKISISFAENGLTVWFISPTPFEKAPGNMKTPDKEILQLITFMYLKNHSDLVTHLNGIHLWRKVPNVIIITGFEHYCNLYSNDYKPLQAALITTTLLDCGVVCATRKGESINLLVACTEPPETDIEKLQTIRDLYFLNHIHKSDKGNSDFYNDIMQLFK